MSQPARAGAWTLLGLLALTAASAIPGRAFVPAGVGGLTILGLLGVAAWAPRAGLIILISAGLLSPWSLSIGAHGQVGVVIPVLAALVAGTLVRALWRRDLGALQPSLAVLPLALLALAAVLSFAVAQVADGCGATAPLAAQLGGLAGLLLPIGACVVAADVLDRAWAQRLTWLFLALGTVAVTTHLAPRLRVLSDSFLVEYANGSLLWVWIVALAAGQAGANQRLRTEWRVALAWLVVLVFYVALSERPAWLSGWVPALAGLATVGALVVPRIAVTALAAGAMLAAGLATRLTHWFERSGDLYSLGTRAEAAVIVSRIIGAHPLLGVGPANYYHCTPLYRIRGYAVPFSSHDNLLDVAAQTGLVGLAGLLLFAAAVAAVGLRFWRRAPAGFDRGFACGALGGLAGTLVAALLGDWWLPFVYNVTLDGLRAAVPAWILLGALLALARDEAR